MRTTAVAEGSCSTAQCLVAKVTCSAAGVQLVWDRFASCVQPLLCLDDYAAPRFGESTLRAAPCLDLQQGGMWGHTHDDTHTAAWLCLHILSMVELKSDWIVSTAATRIQQHTVAAKQSELSNGHMLATYSGRVECWLYSSFPPIIGQDLLLTTLRTSELPRNRTLHVSAWHWHAHDPPPLHTIHLRTLRWRWFRSQAQSSVSQCNTAAPKVL